MYSTATRAHHPEPRGTRTSLQRQFRLNSTGRNRWCRLTDTPKPSPGRPVRENSRHRLISQLQSKNHTLSHKDLVFSPLEKKLLSTHPYLMSGKCTCETEVKQRKQPHRAMLNVFTLPVASKDPLFSDTVPACHGKAHLRGFRRKFIRNHFQRKKQNDKAELATDSSSLHL